MRSKIIFAMALTPFLLSAATSNQAMSKPKAEEQEPTCRSPFQNMHVGVRHKESKGVGYKDGYTTLEGFGIYDYRTYFMPFLDLRWHIFNDGQLAGNFGFGGRTIFPLINHVLGYYLYYDIRQEEQGLTVNQLSPGLELLGKRMEYRINTYFPVGGDESRSYQYKFHRFDNNRIRVQHKKRYAMSGVDGEVGGHITQSTNHDVYAGGGPYFFSADSNSFWGIQSRIYWRYHDYVSIEASYSYDHIFKNIFQGSVAFSYPFGPKLKRTGDGCPDNHDLSLSRAAFAPHRFEIPVVVIRKHSHAAMQPGTNQPITVWFVDNTSSSAGTYDSPFPTLAQAENVAGRNDIIYVFPGDGTTTGMNQGITLQDGQRLFGSGMPQYVKTSKGTIKIPAQTPNAPHITGPSNVVNLGNGNEVAGFFITSPAGYGVLGNPSNGMYVHNNVITTGVGGIGANGYGSLRVQNNVITGTTLIGSTGVAISVISNQFANIDISNNQISNIQNGVLLQPVTVNQNASCNANISNNTISQFHINGIFVSLGMVNSNYTISNNVITDNLSIGGNNAGAITAAVLMTGNAGNYTISNNVINTTTTPGAVPVNSINVNAPNIVTTTANLLINNNMITTGVAGSPSTYNGIRISTSSPVLCAGVSNNTIHLLGSPTAQGMSIGAGAPGVINIDEFNNNIAPNLGMTNVNLVPPGTCGQ
jgi:hypothetical protein